MKKWILTITATSILVAATIHFADRKTAPSAKSAVGAVTDGKVESASPRTATTPMETQPVSTESPVAASVTSSVPGEIEVKSADTNSAPIAEALAVVLSSPSDSKRLQQKPAVWKQLREAGQLDAAIAELKKRAAGHPAAAEYPLAIGEAYIEKIQATENFNERGVLAMQADTSLDEALRLDPANWEAQFMKAASLSHWPSGLGKGPEVIQRLTDLINQQEKLPPQPLFVESYVLLGEQYEKAGNFDYAKAVWQAALDTFPADPTLRERISGLARKPEH